MPDYDAIAQFLLSAGATDPEKDREEHVSASSRVAALTPALRREAPSLEQFTQICTTAGTAERSNVFARWAIDAYHTSCGGKGVVLDIAGGAGELSLLLALNGIRCRLIDPMEEETLTETQQRQLLVAASAASAAQGGADSAASAVAAAAAGDGCNDSARAQHTVEPFERLFEVFKHTPPVDQPAVPDARARRQMHGASFVLGLHPDEASECIVDAAIAAQIPFAVVPCCCRANLFPNCRLEDGSRVTTTVHLCEYLLEKHPAIRATSLPMAGKNRLLYAFDYNDVAGARADAATIAMKAELRALRESGGKTATSEEDQRDYVQSTACHQNSLKV